MFLFPALYYKNCFSFSCKMIVATVLFFFFFFKLLYQSINEFNLNTFSEVGPTSRTWEFKTCKLYVIYLWKKRSKVVFLAVLRIMLGIVVNFASSIVEDSTKSVITFPGLRILWFAPRCLKWGEGGGREGGGREG